MTHVSLHVWVTHVSLHVGVTHVYLHVGLHLRIVTLMLRVGQERLVELRASRGVR